MVETREALTIAHNKVLGPLTCTAPSKALGGSLAKDSKIYMYIERVNLASLKLLSLESCL